jgi:hypothetical protein
VVKLLEKGLQITLDGFADEATLPKSLVPLNGTHHITFGKNLFAADGKAQLWAGGCKGANSSYTPEWTHNQAEMVHPDFPLSLSTFLSLSDRQSLYDKIHTFKETQKKIYSQAAATIRADKQTSLEEKRKLQQKEFDRLLVRGVRAEAAKIQTGCIHHKPFEIAEYTCPCPLHLDTNEYLRVLEHIVQVSSRMTLAHWDSEEHPISFNRASGKKGQTTSLPNIYLCPPDSPLVQVIAILKSAKLSKLAAYFERNHTPPVSQSSIALGMDHVDGEDNELSDELNDFFFDESLSANAGTERRFRLIGESVRKLSPYMSELVKCLKVNKPDVDSSIESSKNFKNRLICHVYVHLLRCLSAMLSVWIIKPSYDEHGIQMLGDLFVALVHNYSLHKSYNTFCFAQVSPFKIKQYLARFQIFPDGCLNIGVYGKNEGGEHRQKLVKEHVYKWTDKQAGCFVSLLDQSMEVYIGGMFLFPDTCPKEVDLASENTCSWITRFGKNFNAGGHCFACGAQLEVEIALHAQLNDSKFSSDDAFLFDVIASKMQDSFYYGSPLKISNLFDKYLRLCFDKFYCDDCVLMCQLLYALHFGLEDKIPW